MKMPIFRTRKLIPKSKKLKQKGTIDANAVHIIGCVGVMYSGE
jgi:hypothetical protein